MNECWEKTTSSIEEDDHQWDYFEKEKFSLIIYREEEWETEGKKTQEFN